MRIAGAPSLQAALDAPDCGHHPRACRRANTARPCSPRGGAPSPDAFTLPEHASARFPAFSHACAIMRLGVVCLWNANAFYRAIYPLKAMERRGHEVLWPGDWEANPSIRRLADCDVVHLYRRADDEIRPLMSKLVRDGTPITYDNDDDFTAVPKQSPDYKKMGGLSGQRYFAA